MLPPQLPNGTVTLSHSLLVTLSPGYAFVLVLLLNNSTIEKITGVEKIMIIYTVAQYFSCIILLTF